jgi:hypothetical protein
LVKKRRRVGGFPHGGDKRGRESFFSVRVSTKPSKTILDEIDRVLAAHYGFTDAELDFIPSTKLRAGNHDIKYRMGRDAETEEE